MNTLANELFWLIVVLGLLVGALVLGMRQMEDE